MTHLEGGEGGGEGSEVEGSTGRQRVGGGGGVGEREELGHVQHSQGRDPRVVGAGAGEEEEEALR
eukprot:3934008-Rhodomonas_salina.2